jgi:transglutaminase-like putative cysteine protease
MSMAKKQPQLELDELRRLKWLLGGLLALIAISSLFYLEISASLLTAAGIVLVPLALFKPAWPARVPALVHTLAFPAVVAFATYDFYAHGEFLPALVRLDVLLLLYRAVTYRKRRDDLQLIVLGLFLIVMAGVITVSLVFAAQIVAFVACALLYLLAITLVDGQEGGVAALETLTVAPAWTHGGWFVLFRRLRETCDWRVFALGGFLFVSLVALSAALFMVIPRFEIDSGLFLDRLITKKSYTGFSDTLKFGDVTDIQQDNSVVLRVEASDRSRVPETLYWRMVVLDEYRDSAFRMSSAMKNSAFKRQETTMRVNGTESLTHGAAQTWTFYLESGVSRFLPLAGGYRRLSFTEPQVLRVSPSLQLVMLIRDPVSMKAYRVDGMNTGDRLADGVFGRLLQMDSALIAGGQLHKVLDTGLGKSDQAVLERIASEITGGEKLDPEEYARRSMIWLAKRHGYALKSDLPKGGGDPLVRWLASTEPGHCELFAGAFALLARTAGFPARVVAGFMGGAWNEDYLIVRNSDAHAWCELYDGRGNWLRFDPTNDGPRLASSGQSSLAASANIRTATRGWASRLDRLQVLWYRRIVNFDRADQQALVQTIKKAAEASGRGLREWAMHWAGVFRDWFAQPWNVRRWGLLTGIGATAGVLGWSWWRYGRGLWSRWRPSRGKGRIDPVRCKAGHWLRRMDRLVLTNDALQVRESLCRLRYGRRETWPEPPLVFSQARRVLRKR